LQALQTRRRSAHEILHIAAARFRSQQRSIAEERRQLFNPIRQLRENMALPPDRTGQ
jgi:hypothetical protein